MRTLIPNLRRPALSLAAAGAAGLIAVFSLGQPAAAIDIQVVPITDEVDAWLVEDHTNPLITLKFGFEGGSRWDEPGKEGTTSLAFGSLNEGAGEMNERSSIFGAFALYGSFITLFIHILNILGIMRE